MSDGRSKCKRALQQPGPGLSGRLRLCPSPNARGSCFEFSSEWIWRLEGVSIDPRSHAQVRSCFCLLFLRDRRSIQDLQEARRFNGLRFLSIPVSGPRLSSDDDVGYIRLGTCNVLAYHPPKTTTTTRTQRARMESLPAWAQQLAKQVSDPPAEPVGKSTKDSRERQLVSYSAARSHSQWPLPFPPSSIHHATNRCRPCSASANPRHRSRPCWP